MPVSIYKQAIIDRLDEITTNTFEWLIDRVEPLASSEEASSCFIYEGLSLVVNGGEDWYSPPKFENSQAAEEFWGYYSCHREAVCLVDRFRGESEPTWNTVLLVSEVELSYRLTSLRDGTWAIKELEDKLFRGSRGGNRKMTPEVKLEAMISIKRRVDEGLSVKKACTQEVYALREKHKIEISWNYLKDLFYKDLRQK